MSRAKILLISIRNDLNIIQEELGIGYIGSYLRKKDFSVRIETFYYNEFNYDIINEYSPDIIGFSVYDESMWGAIKIANKVKEIAPRVLIVFGGYAPTYHSWEIMQACASVDVIIRGEGENAFLNISLAFTEQRNFFGIKGILYRDNGSIIENQGNDCIDNLDELPFPARDILVQKKLSTAYVSTSRGCTGQCKFCCSPKFFKKGWRGRSVSNVIAEIKTLYNEYGVKRIHFIDSSFEDPDVNLIRLETMLDELLNLNLNIVYSADFRVDFYKKANDQIMQKLKKLKFIYVFLGVEAGNNRDLDVYGKRVTVFDIEKCIELFYKNDINIDIGFINFNPYSTYESLRDNMTFLHKHGLDSYMLNIRQLRVYNGTKLYEQIKKDKLYINDYEYHFVNERIEQMYNFIKNIFNGETEHKFMLYCQHYSVNYKHTISKIKQLGYTQVAEEALNIVQPLLKQISDNNFRWFNALINLAEEGWNDEKAYEITLEKLNIQNLLKLMQRIYIKLERLKKLNPEVRGLL